MMVFALVDTNHKGVFSMIERSTQVRLSGRKHPVLISYGRAGLTRLLLQLQGLDIRLVTTA
jgi:hypothetical protein